MQIHPEACAPVGQQAAKGLDTGEDEPLAREGGCGRLRRQGANPIQPEHGASWLRQTDFIVHVAQ